MFNIKRIVRILLGKNISSEEFVNHLRKIGVRVGDGCRFFDPESVVIDKQNPHMIVLGNNVFVRINSIILKNTSIGDNVIIGAGSVISGNVGSNAVHAGVLGKNNVFR